MASLADFAASLNRPHLAIEVAPGDWKGMLVSSSATTRDLMPANPEYCPVGDSLGELGRTDGYPVVSALARSHTRNATLGFELPAQPAYAAGLPPGMASLFSYTQRIDANHPDLELAWNIVGEDGEPGSARLEFCLRYRGEMAVNRGAKLIHLTSGWLQQSSPATPWEGWATGADDTLASAAQTVNLDTFFRVLHAQLAPDSSAVIAQMPLLNIQYLPARASGQRAVHDPREIGLIVFVLICLVAGYLWLRPEGR